MGQRSPLGGLLYPRARGYLVHVAAAPAQTKRLGPPARAAPAGAVPRARQLRWPRDGGGRCQRVDQPANDFSSLFTWLDSSPGYLRAAEGVDAIGSGRSFYEQVFPDEYVDVGWSANAEHSLSRVPFQRWQQAARAALASFPLQPIYPWDEQQPHMQILRHLPVPPQETLRSIADREYPVIFTAARVVVSQLVGEKILPRLAHSLRA